MEGEPVRFFVRELPDLLDRSRATLAQLVGADAEDLAWVANATTGVNSVLRSLQFEPGDELLLMDHAYKACWNAAHYVTQKAGAKIVEVNVPFPIQSADQVVDAVLAKVTPRTKLAMLDHITSPTGLVLPIARLVSELDKRGVDCLVDGAHAPGQVPLDLNALGAAYYTGNCHKWLCTPKGAALLHVRKDRQEGLHPLQISHGHRMPLGDKTRYQLEFEWQGTDNPSAYLCVKDSIEFLGALFPNGWTDIMAHNHALALQGRAIICSRLGLEPGCPDDMVGSLAAFALPSDHSLKVAPGTIHPLCDALYSQYAIEVPVSAWPGPSAQLLRISAQLYNAPEQYEYLAESLAQLL